LAKIPVRKFEEILRLVWSHLITANVHLTIWEELWSTSDRKRLCNTYRGFFYWTRDAHVDRFIQKICIVTDADKSQPSIHKLANMIQAHPNLAPGIAFTDVIRRMNAHVQLLNDIRAVRDRRSSHWDLKKKPPEPDVAKCRGLLVELNVLLEDIWNEYKPNQTGGRNFYSLIPSEHNHTSYVLDRLTKTMLGDFSQKP